MKLKQLHMENIRCYRSLDIIFENGLTLIQGKCGSGKSSFF
ncbi:MAG: AAA family ATPase [Methanosarcinales archaeon]|nr:AAA family ATPase [Methanosarcinales archaeon]